METARVSSDWNVKDILLYGSLAVGAYLLWQMFSGAKSVITGAAGAITAPIANLWVRLTGAPPMNVLGVVQFPDGTQLDVNMLPIKTDNQGNVYTYAGGITYQLQPWVTVPTGFDMGPSSMTVYPAVAVGT
jgi:hypothetical protein